MSTTSSALPLVNSKFAAGSSGRTANIISATGVPGAYVVASEITNPKTGMVTPVTHTLDCRSLDEVEDQMQAYFAGNF